MAIDQPIPIPIPTLGLIRSVNREEIPAGGCAELENWLLRDDFFTVRPGLIVFGQNIGERPSNFVQYDHNDGGTRTVMGTDQSWWLYDSVSSVWNSLSGGVFLSSSAQQVFRVFPSAGINWLLGCNVADPMKKWDGTAASYADVGGSPPNARCMMKLFDRIILLGLTSGPNAHPAAVDVSDNKDFDNGWGINQFGPLRDCDGEIVGAEEFGSDIGAIYASDGIHLAVSDGGTAPFRFELKTRLSRDQGLAATLAITRTGRGTHVYLAKDATLKEFDLTSVTQWGSRDLEKYLQDVIDPAAINKSWMGYDPTNAEILIFYPERGNIEPNAGVIVKERTGAFAPIRFGTRLITSGVFIKIDRPWTLGDLNLPLGSISQTLGELASTSRSFALGENFGQSYGNVGLDDLGSPISALFETGLNDFGNQTQEKTLQRLQHRFTRTVGPQNITIKVGYSRHGEERTLSSPKTRDIGNRGPYITGHRKTSKFFSLRMEVDATTQVNWKGSAANIAPRGFR